MKRILLSLVMLLLFSSVARGQNNICAGPDPTDTIASPKSLSSVLAEHTALNPAGQPVVTGYTVSVIQGANTVTSVPVSKTAFTLLPGTPANCYQMALPAFSGVQNNVAYKLGLIAHGQSQSSPMRLSTQSFFLQGVPAEPGSLRLAILNMLSKMYNQILSTSTSKPWFERIGK